MGKKLEEKGLDYSWEDDQSKKHACVKFLAFSKTRRLFGKVAPVEVQILPFQTFCALKASTDHERYAVVRMKGVQNCREIWAQNPDNLDILLKYIEKMDLVPKAELDIFLDIGPW